ncbi:MAG: FkbM family methyltransferase [Desulfotalea sp.]
MEFNLQTVKSLLEKLSKQNDESVIASLCLVRRQLAYSLVSATEDGLEDLLAGETGHIVRLLIQNRVMSIPINTEEQNYLNLLENGYSKCTNWQSENFKKFYIALALYFENYEISSSINLTDHPNWFLSIYLEILLVSPVYFSSVEKSECFHAYMLNFMKQLNNLAQEGTGFWTTEVKKNVLFRLNFIGTYFSEKNTKDLYIERAKFATSTLIALKDNLSRGFPLKAKCEESPQIGIVVGSISDHTETFFLIAHMCKLMDAGFFVHVFCLNSNDNIHSKKVRCLANKYSALNGKNLTDKVDYIRLENPDIVFFATNITATTNESFMLALHRLAPIQTISMASPVTTGLAFSDYFFSAKDNDTDRDAQDYYSEELLLLPGSLNKYAYQFDFEPKTITINRNTLGISETDTVFVSCANLFKLNGDLLGNWVEILSKVENSYLILMPYNPNWSKTYPRQILRDNLTTITAKYNIDMNRIKVINPVPQKADVRAVISIADIYLDSFPFSGACSLYDPLAVCVPPIARRGRVARSQHSASILKQWKLNSLVSESCEEYVDMAVKLANDKPRIAELKNHIQGVIMNGNPILNIDSLGRDTALLFMDIYQNEININKELVNTNKSLLIEKIHSKVSLLKSSNLIFQKLTDSALINNIIIPCLKSNHKSLANRHFVDIGACYGQIAKPFLMDGMVGHLYEPDPECFEVVTRNTKQFETNREIYKCAVTTGDEESVTFFKASSNGLSGLSVSPYDKNGEDIVVEALNYTEVLKGVDSASFDFLKIDAEGHDLELMLSYDYKHIRPTLIMVEACTIFPSQTKENIAEAISNMKSNGYECAVFFYNDYGNFAKKIWDYQLDEILINKLPAAEEMNLNIIFYKEEDSLFLVMLVKLLNSLG